MHRPLNGNRNCFKFPFPVPLRIIQPSSNFLDSFEICPAIGKTQRNPFGGPTPFGLLHVSNARPSQCSL
jgi:hypothetical protein